MSETEGEGTNQLPLIGPFATRTGIGLGGEPEELLLCLSAGVLIGMGGLTRGEVVALLVFTVIVASSVLIPVLGYAVAADRPRGALDALGTWLQLSSQLVMAIALLATGAPVIGKGSGRTVTVLVAAVASDRGTAKCAASPRPRSGARPVRRRVGGPG
jgi:Sap, sulfolipid-1-addressing protein